MSENRYDFIIVGGGPAGSTAGTFLARKGYKVLILEKEKFPRPHVGESMLSQSYFLFKELGVLDEMAKRFIRKPGVIFSDNKGLRSTEWLFKDVIPDESYLSFHVSRDEFDDLLLRNSRKSGVEVIEEAKVVSVDLKVKDEVTVKAILKGNSKINYSGKFFLDASGQGALLAKQFNAKKELPGITSRIAINTRWEGASLCPQLTAGNLKIVRHELEGGGWMWMIPIKENLLSVGVVLSSQFFHARRHQLQKENNNDWMKDIYREIVFGSVEATDILKDANMINDLQMNADYSYDNDMKYGKNFACIGDASSFVDPIFASGVYIAMKSAQVVVEALDSKFRLADHQVMENAYANIAGAYKIVKSLVANFYDPDAIKIDELSRGKIANFEQQTKAFKIFNLLLSGKFFDAPASYLNTVNLLRDEKKFQQFEHYVKSQ